MKPTLFVLAAGMGSRYGGLKQLDGLGPHGETIMDYSIYDAIKSGFGKVVFVIRKDFEQDFREKILSKYIDHIPTEVVFQSVNDLPEGFVCPLERTKPWGTNHAVLMGRNSVVERTKIGYNDKHDIVFTDDGSEHPLKEDTPVSMNFWGFTPDYFAHSEDFFIRFLKENINAPKAEFYIPSLVNELVGNKTAEVKVLKTTSKWFGVTYAEDRPTVVEKFAQLHEQGVYPEKMF